MGTNLTDCGGESVGQLRHVNHLECLLEFKTNASFSLFNVLLAAAPLTSQKCSCLSVFWSLCMTPYKIILFCSRS